MRLAMGVEYDGSSYHGWQLQKSGVRSVQQQIEQALGKVAAHPVRVFCAGRTDTGVHGEGQVIHFDTPAVRSLRGWVLGTNVNLPDDVNINWVHEVSDEFHARFSATSRSYRYVILNRPTRSAIWRDRAVWIHHVLDEVRMQQAAESLVGTHDFSSYRAIGCQAKSPVRTVTNLIVNRINDRVVIEITANAFLHHMVRNIAGVLMTIGRGDQPVEWSREVLDHRDRTLGGVTAPPQGLYLVDVDYPAEFGLPSASKV
ncbi:MAG: tRNA pseudouridine(38-40) synthase TruA [Sedimenticola selenatireducens]|uniref:tRNA pseudouridine synthase A n=2 Tax=Sedimenticola selenatireducens TaxID=191960 RepID=A0A557SKG2_9GAMM|nr:tRNA pseudouridine(38-40) synthase TruA [Sedimenticola selenatireducens]TVT65236.1 MAG: tRNA pseudouridine(38-40) synthase TruA [Sedimenticola selenatireducens]